MPNLSTAPASQEKPPPLSYQQIKLQTIERLRKWEVEHASTFDVPKDLHDNAPPGELRNAWTRRGSERFIVDPNVDDADELLDTQPFGRDDLVDVGNDRVFLRRGDLVELL